MQAPACSHPQYAALAAADGDRVPVSAADIPNAVMLDHRRQQLRPSYAVGQLHFADSGIVMLYRHKHVLSCLHKTQHFIRSGLQPASNIAANFGSPLAAVGMVTKLHICHALDAALT